MNHPSKSLISSLKRISCSKKENIDIFEEIAIRLASHKHLTLFGLVTPLTWVSCVFMCLWRTQESTIVLSWFFVSMWHNEKKIFKWVLVLTLLLLSIIVLGKWPNFMNISFLLYKIGAIIHIPSEVLNICKIQFCKLAKEQIYYNKAEHSLSYSLRHVCCSG